MTLLQASTQRLQQRLEQISPLVGNTPLVQIRRLHSNPNVKIFAKIESQQFGGSIKSRPVLNILRSAVEEGRLGDGISLVDAAGYNTAVSYASVAAAAGISVQLFVPEALNQQQLALLHQLGASVVLTDPRSGLEGAASTARRFADADPRRYFFANHIDNDANWLSHYETTAEEILTQSFGTVTHFVSGVGTGGTFNGTVRRLREFNKKLVAVALQPETPLHGITGWEGNSNLSGNGHLDRKIANEILRIPTREAIDLSGTATRRTGLLISPSAAANLVGAIKVSEQIDHGVIVTIIPDQQQSFRPVITASNN